MGDYLRTPFAVGGTLSSIPNDVQGDGSVSMTEGFGADYAKSLTGDPSALTIDRAQFNYLVNIICNAVRYIQQNGFPAWISSADNGGSPYSYAINAVVRYTVDSKLYLSLVGSNTATPGTDPTKWELITFDFNPMPMVTVTGAAPHTTAMASNTSYLSLNTALETFSLPTTPADQDEVMIIGSGTGGWKVSQTVAGSTQRLWNIVSTAGVTGYSYSTGQYDALRLKYSASLNSWIAMPGGITGNPAVH